jgi:hypothetical protein
VRTLRDELQEGREESRLSLHELREAVLASELQSLTSSADTNYSGDSNMDSIRCGLDLGSESGFRIRIDFDDLKLKKNYSWKFNFYFLDQKLQFTYP